MQQPEIEKGIQYYWNPVFTPPTQNNVQREELVVRKRNSQRKQLQK